MKKFIIIFYLLLFSNLLFSQARMGYSAKELLAEFSDYRYDAKTDYASDGSFFVSIQTEFAMVGYFFDKQDINHTSCNSMIILPKTTTRVNFYVQEYNSKYVILSKVQWRAYLPNGTYLIDLLTDKDGLMYFSWTTETD
jgi:hypothetical protein